MGHVPERYFPSEKWAEVRLDIDPSGNPDIVGTATDMRKVRDQSMDAVYSQHCLEHLSEVEAWRSVQEMLRVLRPTGYALIVVPNIKKACQWIAEGGAMETAYWSEAGPIRPIDIVYSCQYLVANSGNPFMSHRFGYTKETLGLLFQRFGFADVRVVEDEWELTCLAFVKEKASGDDVGGREAVCGASERGSGES